MFKIVLERCRFSVQKARSTREPASASSGPAIGLQDLFLVLPQGVAFRLFAVPPTRVGSASDLPKISNNVVLARLSGNDAELSDHAQAIQDFLT
jgi:hypothetical protein